MNSDSILGTLRKIKRLTGSPNDGERAAAAAKLAELLDRHGLTEADLIDDARRECEFAFSGPYERVLLIQIVGCVLDVRQVPSTRLRRSRARLWFSLTMAEEREARAMWAAALPDLRRTLDEATAAFIHAAKLYPDAPADKDARKPLDAAEVARMIQMAQAIRATTFVPRLEAPAVE